MDFFQENPMREARIAAGRLVREARRRGKEASFGIDKDLGELALVWWMTCKDGHLYSVQVEDLHRMGNRSYQDDYALCTIAR